MKRTEFTENLNQIISAMTQLLDSKGHDYADDDDVFRNFRLSEQAGISVWKGIAVRLSDKMSRLLSFASRSCIKVKSESVEDTLLDLANYAVLCLIAYREYMKPFEAADMSVREEELKKFQQVFESTINK